MERFGMLKEFFFKKQNFKKLEGWDRGDLRNFSLIYIPKTKKPIKKPIKTHKKKKPIKIKKPIRNFEGSSKGFLRNLRAEGVASFLIKKRVYSHKE